MAIKNKIKDKNMRGKIARGKNTRDKNTRKITSGKIKESIDNTLHDVTIPTVASDLPSLPVVEEEKIIETKRDDNKNQSITIYAVGKHRRIEALGCYGISVYQHGKRKPENHSGHFDSTILAETHLKTLCHAVSLVENPFDYSTIEIVTDFAVVDKFTSGLVIDWKNRDWVSKTNKPIASADLFAEFLKLYQDYPITFTIPDPKEKKLAVVQGVLEKELKAIAKAVIQEDIDQPILKQNEKAFPKTDEVTDVVAENIVTKLTKKGLEDSSVSTSEKESVEKLETIDQTIVKPITQTETTAIHIATTLKDECEVLFEQMGLDVNTAVTMLLKQALRNKGLSIQL